MTDDDVRRLREENLRLTAENAQFRERIQTLEGIVITFCEGQARVLTDLADGVRESSPLLRPVPVPPEHDEGTVDPE